jgi:hypothetical protein
MLHDGRHHAFQRGDVGFQRGDVAINPNHGLVHHEVIFSAGVNPTKRAQFLKIACLICHWRHMNLVGVKERDHLVTCPSNAKNINFT